MAITLKWKTGLLAKYIKGIIKYVERCLAKKMEFPITSHDGLFFEENVKLYDFFIEKCNANVYASILKNMKADMVDNRKVFEKMSLLIDRINSEVLGYQTPSVPCPALQISVL